MKNKKIILAIAVIAISLISGYRALAADEPNPTPYNLLAPLPTVENGSDSTTAKPYIKGVIELVIALAGALAVIKLIIAGIEYMTTDALGKKDDARHSITDALWGFLLAISAWLILFTINPNLITLNFKLKPVDTKTVCQPNIPSTDKNTATSGCTGRDNPNAGCANCSPASSFSFPTSCTGDNCLIDPALGNKLQTLAKNLKDKGINWTVTQLYGSGVSISSCHSTGTCADAVITDLSNNALIDSSKINAFLFQISQDVGDSFLYEVKTCERKQALISQTLLKPYAAKIKSCLSTTGENVHINLNGGDSGSCGTLPDGTTNERSCP